jgi:hypothetical protein
MSIENRQGPPIVATLTRRVGRSTDSTHIADSIVEIWSEAEFALTPLIGREGVAALLKRSLFLSASSHSWLWDSQKGNNKFVDVNALRTTIANQTAEEASAGGATLFLQFYGLLTTLIGPSLADRILESAWVDPSRGETAQDPT